MRTRQEEIQVSNSSGGVHNVLAGGTVLCGTIVTESDFRLDGRIEGDINCKGKIVVGPKGSIMGNIVSEHAEILGSVEGTIHIKEKLILKSTANIKGDIYTQTLEIEPGAIFNGTCTMSGKNPLEDKNPKINLSTANID